MLRAPFVVLLDVDFAPGLLYPKYTASSPLVLFEISDDVHIHSFRAYDFLYQAIQYHPDQQQQCVYNTFSQEIVFNSEPWSEN